MIMFVGALFGEKPSETLRRPVERVGYTRPDYQQGCAMLRHLLLDSALIADAVTTGNIDNGRR